MTVSPTRRGARKAEERRDADGADGPETLLSGMIGGSAMSLGGGGGGGGGGGAPLIQEIGGDGGASKGAAGAAGGQGGKPAKPSVKKGFLRAHKDGLGGKCGALYPNGSDPRPSQYTRRVCQLRVVVKRRCAYH